MFARFALGLLLVLGLAIAAPCAAQDLSAQSVQLDAPVARPWWQNSAPRAYTVQRAAMPRPEWNAGFAFAGAFLVLAADAGITALLATVILDHGYGGGSGGSYDFNFGPALGAFAVIGIGAAMAPALMGLVASALGNDSGVALGLSILGSIVGLGAAALMTYAFSQAAHDDTATLVFGAVTAGLLGPAGAAGGFALGASLRDARARVSVSPLDGGAMVGVNGQF